MSAVSDTESTSADTRRIYDALPDGWHSREFAVGFAEGLLHLQQGLVAPGDQGDDGVGRYGRYFPRLVWLCADYT